MHRMFAVSKREKMRGDFSVRASLQRSWHICNHPWFHSILRVFYYGPNA